VLEWTDPLFSMGNWGPELIEIAGGEPLLAAKGQHSRAIAAERLREADPEFLIVAPCGFDQARSAAERIILERLPFWSELRAVRANRVFFADGNLYFNRSGMTVARTAEIIAEILHGVSFPADASVKARKEANPFEATYLLIANSSKSKSSR
jgi:iron complex transport system substrate-binding protein